MHWILAARDGSLIQRVEAEDPAAAYEVLAKKHGYASFHDMSLDLGYARSDFEVSRLTVEVPEYDPDGNRIAIQKQERNIVDQAWRALRRLR